jgi:hypothetical protein
VNSYASLAYTTKTQGVELYFYPTAFYNTLFYFGINMTVWVDNAGKLTYGSAITGTTSYVNEKADSILTLNKWNHILIKFDEITPTTCKIMFDDSTTYANGEVALFRLLGKK